MEKKPVVIFDNPNLTDEEKGKISKGWMYSCTTGLLCDPNEWSPDSPELTCNNNVGHHFCNPPFTTFGHESTGIDKTAIGYNPNITGVDGVALGRPVFADEVIFNDPKILEQKHNVTGNTKSI